MRPLLDSMGASPNSAARFTRYRTAGGKYVDFTGKGTRWYRNRAS